MRLFTLTWFGCFLFGATWAQASDSLANPETSRTLTPGERSRFGKASASLRYDPRMIRAAEMAARRAHPKMTWHCWKYVKDALLAAQLISERPSSVWAKQAGEELVGKFGFERLAISDPLKAPVGAVIVYGGRDAGHVELRTATGFVSDFASDTPYPRPLIGVFVKRS